MPSKSPFHLLLFSFDLDLCKKSIGPLRSAGLCQKAAGYREEVTYGNLNWAGEVVVVVVVVVETWCPGLLEKGFPSKR